MELSYVIAPNVSQVGAPSLPILQALCAGVTSDHKFVQKDMPEAAESTFVKLPAWNAASTVSLQHTSTAQAEHDRQPAAPAKPSLIGNSEDNKDKFNDSDTERSCTRHSGYGLHISAGSRSAAVPPSQRAACPGELAATSALWVHTTSCTPIGNSWVPSSPFHCQQ